MKTTCKILVLLAGLAFILEAQDVPDQNDPIVEAVRRNPMSPQLLLNLEQTDRRLLPAFLEMLGNPTDGACWPKAMAAAAIVGGDDAVEPLLRFLTNRFDGEVDRVTERALIYVPVALGLAAWMDSERALEFLLNHYLPSQWLDVSIRWSRGATRGHSQRRLLAAMSWEGLRTSGRPEARKVFERLATDPGAEYAALREHFPSLKFGVATFDQQVRERQETRAAMAHKSAGSEPLEKVDPRTPEQRAVALRAAGAAEFNWDGDRPAAGRPARQVLPASQTAALRPVALAEFERITKAATEKGLASVVNDLADDAAPIRPFIEGEFRGPIPGSDPSVDSIDYGGDLAQALGILSAARARGLQYGEALAYQFADGRLAVAVPLVGTEEIRAARLPQGAPTVTISDRGEFQIYMVRYEGRWYWNPFGW